MKQLSKCINKYTCVNTDTDNSRVMDGGNGGVGGGGSGQRGGKRGQKETSLWAMCTG